MNRRALVLTACFLLVIGANAAEPVLTSREGLLVLRNGGLLSGHVTRSGDLYLVTLGDRSEVRVPVRDVEMYCLDATEAYLRWQARLAPKDTAGRLDLADWCLRQGLVGCAAEQLLEVLAMEPQNPRIRGLERRLQTAVEQPASPQLPAEPKTIPISLDELDRATNRLPEGLLAEFTSQIQPLLLNRCGASSCHGTASRSEFRLVRPSWTKTISRRFTQRNVHAVLQQMDESDPAASPLLRRPAEPHGGMETSVFGPREKEYFDLLAAWVRQAAAPAKPNRPDAIAAMTSGVQQASYSPHSVATPAAADIAPSRGAEMRLLPASAEAEFVPRDLFDPEVFNRRTPAPASP